MLIFPLHGTLDLHDGIGVLIVASTLALWTALSALRERMDRSGMGTIPRRRPVLATEDAPSGALGHTPGVSPGDAARALSPALRAAVLARRQSASGTIE